jgi:tetratricopeptide (TPR) repeat protein
LEKRGRGEAALRIARALLNKTSSYGSPSASLMRLLAAAGATDEVLAIAAKMSDYRGTERATSYVAVAAHYRKTGRSEEAAKLLQQAHEITEKQYSPVDAVLSLAKTLREVGEM